MRAFGLGLYRADAVLSFWPGWGVGGVYGV